MNIQTRPPPPRCWTNTRKVPGSDSNVPHTIPESDSNDPGFLLQWLPRLLHFDALFPLHFKGFTIRFQCVPHQRFNDRATEIGEMYSRHRFHPGTYASKRIVIPMSVSRLPRTYMVFSSPDCWFVWPPWENVFDILEFLQLIWKSYN